MAIRRPVTLAVLAAAVCAASAAGAADKVAVFPLEVPDFIAEGEYIPKPAKEGPRAALATDELRALMAKTGKYEVIDLAPHAAAVKDAQPIHKCNGCEIELARKLGARYAMTGLAEKASDTLFNISLRLVDVDTGAPVRLGSTIVQGNTDDMWLRSVRYLMKNRIDPKDETK